MSTFRRMTTWATCGDGRPREAAPSENSNLAPSNSDNSRRYPDATPTNSEEIPSPIEDSEEPAPAGSRFERLGLNSMSERAEVGWRVKRIFDEGRVSYILSLPYSLDCTVQFHIGFNGSAKFLIHFLIYLIIGEVRERCFRTGKRTALALLCKKCVAGKRVAHRLERKTELNTCHLMPAQCHQAAITGFKESVM